MRTIIIGVVGTLLILGVVGITNDWPWFKLFIIAGVFFSGPALGVAVRRWVDRSVAKDLASRATPFTVGYRSGARGGPYYEVTTTFAGRAKWFFLYDRARLAKWFILYDRARLRLFGRRAGRRLPIDDDGFNREVYLDRNPKVGAVLFASAETREAARAIFRMGFFAIEYRDCLLSALRRDEVPDDVAVAVRPHLLVLAAKAGEVSDQPLQRPRFAASLASASAGGAVQTRKGPLMPTHLLVLDMVGCVLLGVGVAKQFGAIDVIPVQFRFQGYGVMFIVVGIVLMAPTFIRVITKIREQVRAEPGHKP